MWVNHGSPAMGTGWNDGAAGSKRLLDSLVASQRLFLSCVRGYRELQTRAEVCEWGVAVLVRAPRAGHEVIETPTFAPFHKQMGQTSMLGGWVTLLHICPWRLVPLSHASPWLPLLWLTLFFVAPGAGLFPRRGGNLPHMWVTHSPGGARGDAGRCPEAHPKQKDLRPCPTPLSLLQVLPWSWCCRGRQWGLPVGSKAKPVWVKVCTSSLGRP